MSTVESVGVRTAGEEDLEAVLDGGDIGDATLPVFPPAEWGVPALLEGAGDGEVEAELEYRTAIVEERRVAILRATFSSTTMLLSETETDVAAAEVLVVGSSVEMLEEVGVVIVVVGVVEVPGSAVEGVALTAGWEEETPIGAAVGIVPAEVGVAPINAEVGVALVDVEVGVTLVSAGVAPISADVGVALVDVEVGVTLVSALLGEAPVAAIEESSIEVC